MYPPIDTAAVERAARILSEGGLVAIPTETVYGLAADADNRDAVLKTFAVKGRPTNHPLIVHIAGPEALSAWACVVPEEARLLAKAFWPGPLTMVLPKSERCGGFVTGGQASVALRCPSHPWIQALLKRFAGSSFKGLTAPSANTFGKISPTCAAHVAEDLGVKPEGSLDMILDGGRCEVGVESTIINLSGERPEILRHGAVTRAMLEAVLGRPVPDAGSDAPRASGRLKSHYAPGTPVTLFSAKDIAALAAGNDKVAVMATSDVLDACKKAFGNRIVLELVMSREEADWQHSLYENLHRLDKSGAARLLIEQPPQTPEWAAVNDRLGRAAAAKDA